MTDSNPPFHWPVRRHALAMACAAIFAGVACHATAATRAVQSCADDGGPTTLRSVIAAANIGDTIDMSALACSTITLGATEIEIDVDNLNIVGPGEKLTIDAGGKHRVFNDAVRYRNSLRIANVTLANGYLSAPRATGGCVMAEDGDITFDHATLHGCGVHALGGGSGFTGYGLGGAAYAGYTITATNSTFTGNSATSVANSSFYSTYGAGGALYAHTITATASTFSGNSAGVTGDATSAGGALAGGTVTLTQSTVTGNHVVGGHYAYYAYGGGVSAREVKLDRSTVDNNLSDGGGGGIASTTFECYDSTVSGNHAADGSGGGATLVAFTSAACTIAFNRASAGGGGIYMFGNSSGGTWTLDSTIIAQNIADPGATFAADLGIGTGSHPPITAADNLIMTADSGAVLPPSTIHTSPQLLPLAANGGPTRTHALPAASVAVDTGNNNRHLTTDQRGQARVYGTAADIGAYELQPDRIFANGFDLN